MSVMIRQEKIGNFTNWLVNQGCEMLPLTNEFEVIRFRAKAGTGVIYKGAKGYSPNGPMASDAYLCFIQAKKWPGKGRPTKRIGGSKRKRELLDRDGDRCCYCDFPLGDDMTIEHFVAINQKGPDRLENTALAHEMCNRWAGSLSVMGKMKLRDTMRGFNANQP